MSWYKLIFMLLLTVLLSSGCSVKHHVMKANTIAHDYKEIDRVTEASQPRSEVIGRGCDRFITLVPIWLSFNIDSAIEEALKNSKSDGLKDVTVEISRKIYLIYNEECYLVRGTPVFYRGKSI